jgi:hypothetical protein
MAEMATLLLTQEEIDALGVAVAKGVCAEHYPIPPTNASEACAVVYEHAEIAGPVLCSLATMLAEAKP